MIKNFVRKLAQLPITPGVYQFLNAKKKIVYVGKAANVKSRVTSYFRTSADLAPMKQRMIADVRDIRFIPTASEIEALLLEANLIKKLQPYYNVTLRDDKSYLYVKVSTEEEWPRVFATRKIERAGTYFGPFTSANAVREVLRVLRKVLPYRCNQKPIDQKTSPPPSPLRRGRFFLSSQERLGEVVRREGKRQRACFWYHLGRCPGTCVGAISKEEYRKIIRRIILFFEGRMDELRRAMKKELGPERVALMENVLAHTRILSVGEHYASDARDLARVLGIPSLHRIEGYDISNIMGREATGSMVVFVDGEPAKSEYKRFKIKTVTGANDVKMLEEVLTRRMRHSIPVEVRLPKGSPTSEDRWPMPDLIIVDGGKAQLNAVVRTLHRLQGSSRPRYQSFALVRGGLRSNSIATMPVIAVAKGGHGGVLRQKEEIYFPGERMPLQLPNNSPALHLVLRVRDEAHRFAIGYHKMLRRERFLG